MTNKLSDKLIKIHKELESNDYMTDSERLRIRNLIKQITDTGYMAQLLNPAKLDNLTAQAIALWENAQERKKKENVQDKNINLDVH